MTNEAQRGEESELMPLLAALFVQTEGAYFGIENIDPWDEKRDARKYCGPHPVVAHPPCQRWGKMWAGQPLWIKRTGPNVSLPRDYFIGIPAKK